jgi:uncharacterized membrane protein
MENNQTGFEPRQTLPPGATVSDSFGHGWERLKKYFPELLLVLIVQILLSAPMGVGNLFGDEFATSIAFQSLFNLVYGLVVLAPVSYGSSWIYLKAVRGEDFKVSDMFFAFQQIGNVILATLLTGAIIGIGFVLLIVPGIIFACKLAFVPYLVMDRKMEAVEAIRKSWEMTTGHAGTIFWMGVVSFFVGLLGLICLIVGIIPAAIWITLAFATIYWSVSEKKPENPASVS